jgi:hypothetical protein
MGEKPISVICPKKERTENRGIITKEPLPVNENLDTVKTSWKYPVGAK